jgi:hypothetical protein
MSIEAMKQALEALGQMQAKANFECWNLDICDKAITALSTAIEQAETAPVQEPVAWVFRRSLIQKFRWHRDKPVGQEALLYWEPLYTPPPAAQRQPLTDKQIADIQTVSNLNWVNLNCKEHLNAFVRAIEQAHGITGESK